MALVSPDETPSTACGLIPRPILGQRCVQLGEQRTALQDLERVGCCDTWRGGEPIFGARQTRKFAEHLVAQLRQGERATHAPSPDKQPRRA